MGTGPRVTSSVCRGRPYSVRTQRYTWAGLHPESWEPRGPGPRTECENTVEKSYPCPLGVPSSARSDFLLSWTVPAHLSASLGFHRSLVIPLLIATPRAEGSHRHDSPTPDPK